MDGEYKFEKYEKYFGEKEEVMRKIDECEVCGSKLVFSHFPDYKNLIVQETARCMECGSNAHKIIHVLN